MAIRESAGKCWCFTLNNPTLSEPEIVSSLIEVGADYAVFQLETGASGTPHFQGYVVLSVKKRLSPLREAIPGAHWEKARGTPKQNREYCTKPEGRIGEFCEIGVFPEIQQGKRKDLERLHFDLKHGLSTKGYRDEYFSLFVRYPNLVANFKYAACEPRQQEQAPFCWLLIGKSGTGKSRYARLISERIGGGLYNATLGEWFDGYGGERSILFDDFRGSSLSFSTFKLLIDRYPIRVAIKGTSCAVGATRFFITSNFTPDTWWSKEVTGEDLTPLYRRIQRVLHFTRPDHFFVYDSVESFMNRPLVRVDGVYPVQEVQAPLQAQVQEEIFIDWTIPQVFKEEVLPQEAL